MPCQSAAFRSASAQSSISRTNAKTNPCAFTLHLSHDTLRQRLRTTANSAKIVPAPNGVVGNTLCLNAGDAGQSDAYRRIESVFGTGAVESPSDTQYTPTRPHVMQRGGDGWMCAKNSLTRTQSADISSLSAIRLVGLRSRSTPPAWKHGEPALTICGRNGAFTAGTTLHSIRISTTMFTSQILR